MQHCKSHLETAIAPDELQALAIRPLFQNVSTEQITCFLTEAYLQDFSAKTILLRQRQHTGVVMILLNGSVKVHLPENQHSLHQTLDSERILNILGPGEILGELDAVDGKGHSTMVETLETTRCLCIPCALFNHCLQEMPKLSYNLLHVTAARMRYLTDKAGVLSSLRASGRLAYHLLNLAERYGEPNSQGSVLLPIRLTQKTLAGLACTSREHVNKKLGYFRQRKYLSIHQNLHISLHNMEALRRECQ